MCLSVCLSKGVIYLFPPDVGYVLLSKLLKEKFNKINDYWSPKIIGELNGQLVKLAKISGEFVWHSHEKEDELFMVIKGELTIKLKSKLGI